MKLRATKQSAFLAGFSIGVLCMAMDLAHTHGLPIDPDGLLMEMLIIGYVLVTGIFFVMGLPAWITDGSDIPPYIPRTRAQWTTVSQRWVRMFLCFLGAGIGFALLTPFK